MFYLKTVLLLCICTIVSFEAFAADERAKTAATLNKACLKEKLSSDQNTEECIWIASKHCETDFNVRGSHECEVIILESWQIVLNEELTQTDMTKEEQSHLLENLKQYSNIKCGFYGFAGPIITCRVEEYGDLARLIFADINN